MPPEQDDPRTRQIEALRRYVNELGFQQQRPEVDRGRGRPSFPWLLLTGVLGGCYLLWLLGAERKAGRI